METRPVPAFNGIPALGLGTYPLSGQDCTDSVKMAVGLGYRHIDTAQMYGNEREVGAALKSCGVPRNQIFVTTKVDPSNNGKARFSDSVKRSIDDLGGPVDLLLIHWPPPDAEIDATLDLLKAEHVAGRTARIGVSNFTPRMLRQAAKRLPEIACNQVEFHPLLDQRELKKAADALSVPLVAYSPVARGRTFQNGVIKAIAEKHKRPPSEIVLRWIVQQGVVAIPKTSKRDHAASNLNIFLFELTPDEMTAISGIGSSAGRTINPGWMSGRWND